MQGLVEKDRQYFELKHPLLTTLDKGTKKGKAKVLTTQIETNAKVKFPAESKIALCQNRSGKQQKS
jgi:hypothetical protein